MQNSGYPSTPNNNNSLAVRLENTATRLELFQASFVNVGRTVHRHQVQINDLINTILTTGMLTGPDEIILLLSETANLAFLMRSNSLTTQANQITQELLQLKRDYQDTWNATGVDMSAKIAVIDQAWNIVHPIRTELVNAEREIAQAIRSLLDCAAQNAILLFTINHCRKECVAVSTCLSPFFNGDRISDVQLNDADSMAAVYHSVMENYNGQIQAIPDPSIPQGVDRKLDFT